jgi:hypothetical protein
MIATIATATAIALASFAPRTDTTVAVPAGTRLVIENFAGEVVVGTWSKNAVRIEADHSARSTIEIERDGSTLAVRPRGRHGAVSSVDFRITAPASVALEISGTYTDVTVQGSKAEIAVETVRGDVSVTGGAGHIALESVEGEVALEGGRGRAELNSVNAGVRVKDHDGDLVAETVNGEIVLEDVRGASVAASTVNGDVLYDGEMRGGGRYSFATHNGDITVALQAQPNVTVSVATFSGDFYSSFPVKVTSTHRNKRMRFTLGSGSAELELESFQGAIRIEQRGGTGMDRARGKMKEDKEKMKEDKEKKHEDGENVDEQ